jgi:hypothetical protein
MCGRALGGGSVSCGFIIKNENGAQASTGNSALLWIKRSCCYVHYCVCFLGNVSRNFFSSPCTALLIRAMLPSLYWIRILYLHACTEYALIGSVLRKEIRYLGLFFLHVENLRKVVEKGNDIVRFSWVGDMEKGVYCLNVVHLAEINITNIFLSLLSVEGDMRTFCWTWDMEERRVREDIQARFAVNNCHRILEKIQITQN